MYTTLSFYRLITFNFVIDHFYSRFSNSLLNLACMSCRLGSNTSTKIAADEMHMTGAIKQ